MFAPSYSNYPGETYGNAKTRQSVAAQQARKNEQARRLQMFVLHAPISSLLQAREQDPKGLQRPIAEANPTPTPNLFSGAQLDRKPRVRSCANRQQMGPSMPQCATPSDAASPQSGMSRCTRPSRASSLLFPTPRFQAALTESRHGARDRLPRACGRLWVPSCLDLPPSTSASTPSVSVLPHTQRSGPLRQYGATLSALLERPPVNRRGRERGRRRGAAGASASREDDRGCVEGAEEGA
ncbi:hypothetical protein DFH07DRAFT_980877 [Mycena maculata]|uniref:Uncharacterized protein n=1 Tax=Mycena maculata TaxID=230809 RepID=A0AAD7NVC9_9AGAR|nr:hypothetical protein DFH07DRAFT_980877 [Mycena maculata]